MLGDKNGESGDDGRRRSHRCPGAPAPGALPCRAASFGKRAEERQALDLATAGYLARRKGTADRVQPPGSVPCSAHANKSNLMAARCLQPGLQLRLIRRGPVGALLLQEPRGCGFFDFFEL